jgi:hypothetical protein
VQRAGDAFDRNVGPGALYGCCRGEHFSFARALEVAVNLLDDGHASHGRAFARVTRGRGASFTSNVPVARVLIGTPFAVLFEFVDEFCKTDLAKNSIRICEVASTSTK